VVERVSDLPAGVLGFRAWIAEPSPHAAGKAP
jgi:hypothetical protein